MFSIAWLSFCPLEELDDLDTIGVAKAAGKKEAKPRKDWIIWKTDFIFAGIMSFFRSYELELDRSLGKTKY